MNKKIAKLILALEKKYISYKLTVENGLWKFWNNSDNYCTLNDISKIETNSDSIAVYLGGGRVLTIYKDRSSYTTKGVPNDPSNPT
jgi:hypothetical protein